MTWMEYNMNTKENVEQEEKREHREALMFVWIPQEQSHNMEAIEEQKTQEDQSEGSTATEKEGTLYPSLPGLWILDVI